MFRLYTWRLYNPCIYNDVYTWFRVFTVTFIYCSVYMEWRSDIVYISRRLYILLFIYHEVYTLFRLYTMMFIHCSFHIPWFIYCSIDILFFRLYIVYTFFSFIHFRLYIITFIDCFVYKPWRLYIVPCIVTIMHCSVYIPWRLYALFRSQNWSWWAPTKVPNPRSGWRWALGLPARRGDVCRHHSAVSTTVSEWNRSHQLTLLSSTSVTRLQLPVSVCF